MTVLERLGMMSSDSPEAALLASMGFDMRWLRFVRWLVAHGRDPKWAGVKEMGVRDGDTD